jgi:hypothetical protein
MKRTVSCCLEAQLSSVDYYLGIKTKLWGLLATWRRHKARKDESATAEPPVIMSSPPVALAKVHWDCF